MLNKRTGFSLVELLVFVSILSVFFIMAASVVTVSLRNMKFNENKLKATHYASQLEEWLRTQKEINWGGEECGSCVNPVGFTEIVTQQGNPTFCFNEAVVQGWESVGDCSGFNLDSIFKREAVFEANVTPEGYVGQVNATISVSWLDIGNVKRSVQTNTLFSVLEQ